MTDSLVLLDHTADGTLRAPVRELVTLARGLRRRRSTACGPPTAPSPTRRRSRTSARSGSRACTGSTADADLHLSAVLAEAVASLLDATGAGVLLVTSTFENKEVAARLAILTGAGVVTDADGLVARGRPARREQDRVRRHLEHARARSPRRSRS